MAVFANDNRARATALVPPGSTITLNGQNYISSPTDPLHGAGSVDFRKVSPGFTLGWGNIVPRTSSQFSFPVEAGFYYVGQPGLKVSFTGSACDPTQPAAIGCESVNQDAGFQQSLSQFIARNNHNLSYATFLPIFRFGFGYSFTGGKSLLHGIARAHEDAGELKTHTVTILMLALAARSLMLWFVVDAVSASTGCILAELSWGRWRNHWPQVRVLVRRSVARPDRLRFYLLDTPQSSPCSSASSAPLRSMRRLL